MRAARRGKLIVAFAFVFSFGRGAFGEEAEKKPLSKREAIAFAEEFVAKASSAAVASGLDALQPKAVGARLESELWFVGFRSADGRRLRGVVVDIRGEGARLASHNFKEDWLLADPAAEALLLEAATAQIKTPAPELREPAPPPPDKAAGEKAKKPPRKKAKPGPAAKDGKKK